MGRELGLGSGAAGFVTIPAIVPISYAAGRDRSTGTPHTVRQADTWTHGGTPKGTKKPTAGVTVGLWSVGWSGGSVAQGGNEIGGTFLADGFD